MKFLILILLVINITNEDSDDKITCNNIILNTKNDCFSAILNKPNNNCCFSSIFYDNENHINECSLISDEQFSLESGSNINL